MIAAWMLYGLLVGTLAGAGALVVERLLRAHRLPTRWVWLGSMVLTFLWPFGHLLWKSLPRTSGPLPVPQPAGIAVLEPLTVQVARESILRALDGPLLLAWALCTSALLVSFSVLVIRTRRLRRGWTHEEAGGRAVLFSEDLGPAVVGFMRPRIVLPAWCRGLDGPTLRMIIHHELEHLKAGDLRLMLTAGVLPLLFPWHLPLWWQHKRLRMAVEGDCDLRVVRRYPDQVRSYMELLLQVGGREPRTAALIAMLSEPEQTLAQRIRIMTMPFPKKPWLRGVLMAGVGGTLLALACWTPSPSEAPEDMAEVAEVEVVETPFEGRFAIPPTPREVSEGRGVGGVDRPGPVTVPVTVAVPVTVQTAEASKAKETPVGALMNFFRVTWEYLRNWVNGLFGEDQDMGQGTVDATLADAPTFTPYTVRPDIKNRVEIARALEREYPPLLRDAGIGGTVQVWFFIDDTGRVAKLQLNESSGHQALDEAALRVASAIEFTPALNRDKAVPVWISLPITFATSGEGENFRQSGSASEGSKSTSGWPQPPGVQAGDVSAAPTFTPFTVRPDIKNRAEVAQALETEYPPLLRDAGIGGTVQVWFFIDDSGRVAKLQLNQSSGHQALDEAALRVGSAIEFTPAMNEDKAVPVWISLPITFSTR